MCETVCIMGGRGEEREMREKRESKHGGNCLTGP